MSYHGPHGYRHINRHRLPQMQVVSNDTSSSHVVLAKGAAIFLAGRGLGRLFALVSQAILARLLAPAAFGLFALGWTVFRLAEAIGPLGLQAGALRFASATAARDPSSARPTVLRATRMAALSGLLLSVVTLLFAQSLAVHLFHKPAATGILRWFAVGFPFLTVLIVAAGATQALQTTRYVAAVRELGQPLLIALLAPAAVLAGFGVRGAAGGAVIATAVAGTAALVLAARLFPKGAQTVVGISSRALLAVSIPAAAASTFRLLLSWTDRLVVGAYLPSASLGAYHAAAQLAAVLSMIVMGFSGILAAMIVAALAAGEDHRARSLYQTSIKWMLYLATPIFAPLVIVPGDVLTAIFGPAYACAGTALRILALGQGLSLLTGAVGGLLVMTGHERQWVLVAGVSFVTNLGLSLWLTPRWGLAGAAFSTAIALGVLTIFGAVFASRALGGPCVNLKVLKPLAIIALTLLVGFFALPHLPASPAPRLLILLALAAAMLGGGFVILGLDPEERELYAAVRGPGHPRS